jgi:hypothetical protein
VNGSEGRGGHREAGSTMVVLCHLHEYKALVLSSEVLSFVSEAASLLSDNKRYSPCAQFWKQKIFPSLLSQFYV